MDSRTGAEPSVRSSVDRSVADRRRGGEGTGTRQRVLDAAIECIHERGLYRASSNAIAEQAGLTWGVIQYYFGTREALMLAVLEEASRRFDETLRDAQITADTLEHRIAQLFDILRCYYGAPQYLVFTQVIVNLTHDPRTSEQARALLRTTGESASPALRGLLNSVFAGTGVEDPELHWTLFHSLRGLALSILMLSTAEVAERPREEDLVRQGDVLGSAFSLLVDRLRASS